MGLAVIDAGRLIVMANPNRFSVPGAAACQSVVDTDSAFAGKPAVVGQIAPGKSPRQLALEPKDETLLVTNFDSGQVEAVNVGEMPR